METQIIISKFWPRIGAFIIDNIILGIIGLLLSLTMEGFLISIGSYGMILGLLIVTFYQTIFNSSIVNGQTIGKRVMNIQVIDIKGNTINLNKSFLRALILCLPYFTINLTIPSTTNYSIINIIKVSILSIIFIGVIVIFLFNKQTRQSLHDLIVGTYVAKTNRSEEPLILPALSKIPFFAFGATGILYMGFILYTMTLNSTNYDNLLNIHTKLLEIEEIKEASVIEKTTYSSDSETTTFQVKVWVNEIPQEELVNNRIAKKIAHEILTNTKNIDSYDFITISFVKEFNIGISSKKITKTIKQTPTDLRDLLNSSN